MATTKPTLPKGTRDFSPEEMVKRNFIFDTIKSVFRKFGYQEIQTPSMENLETLTGKYGDEGDKLIFKILNSGDFLSKVSSEELQVGDAKKLTTKVSEKALRYDLTVPFARYVVAHQNDISLPFKRFQIQPVWRADRPQKGRYREFYQCDADVVGSESLLNEAEFVLIYQEALSQLGLKDFSILINNRKILSGIAEIIGKPELIIDMTVAIDKLDKIGFDGVCKELLERGFTQIDIEKLQPIIELKGSNSEKIKALKKVLASSEIGQKGIEELETIFNYIQQLQTPKATLPNITLDITLARGLNYYTGAIFEVKSNGVAMGSIGGGGRYDDLTGMFGLKNLSGVGISFGADRIYDVLEELGAFPKNTTESTKVLISNFDGAAEKFALPILSQLRAAGIAAELIGSEEMASGLLSLKNMKSGEQSTLTIQALLAQLAQF
jgi:histidyl-tRNA synthetase